MACYLLCGEISTNKGLKGNNKISSNLTSVIVKERRNLFVTPQMYGTKQSDTIGKRIFFVSLFISLYKVRRNFVTN